MIQFNKAFLNSIIENKIKKKFIICHFLSLINVVFEILSLVLIIPIISFFLDFENKFLTFDNLNYFSNLEKIEKAFFIFFVVLTYYIIRAFGQLFIFSYERKFIARIEVKLKENVFERTVFTNLNKLGKSTLAKRLRDLSDVGVLQKHIHSLINFNSSIIVSLSIISFLFIFNFKISLFFLIIFSILSLCYIFFTNNFYVKSGVAVRDKSAEVMNEVYNSLNSLKELIIDKKRNYFFNLFSKANKEIQKISYLTAVYGRIPRIFGELGLIVIILLTFLYFYLMNLDSDEIILNLSVFITAGVKLLPTFVQLANSRQALVQSHYSAEKIYKVLQQPMQIEKETVNTRKQLNIKKFINVKNLSFEYSKSNKIFHKINLTIKSKKIIGLIGESGSGKTTLINLLTGLIKPNSGNIKIDNLDIQENLDSWHNSIGYVPQDVFLLSGKIKNNIAFGIKDNEIDKKKINKILKICKLDDFISKKKRGLDFYINEKSTNISGGQKQRIGIARALYKNPKLLILDEATSGIDQENETLILKNLKREYKNITIILITHRVNTLKRFADTVYRIVNKRIKNIKI